MVRTWGRNRWPGGKLDLVWTFMVCINDSAWFLKALCCVSLLSSWWFLELFLVIFVVVFWGWFLAGFLFLGTCPCASLAGDFALRTPFNRRRFGGFSSCSRSWPREPRSGDSLWLRAFRCDSFGGEDAKEVTRYPQSFSAIRGVNPEIGQWEVEGWPATSFSGRRDLTAIGGGLTALGLPGGRFDFAWSFSVILSALNRGAF
jgi:hypothetical protein